MTTFARLLSGLKSRMENGRRPSGRSRSATFPPDYDDSVKETISAVRSWTMVNREGLNALIQATAYVSHHGIEGDIVECGVWRGGSMQAVARTLLAQGDQERHLYLFDTFEGMPPPSEFDVRHDGSSARDLLAQDESRRSHVWAVAGLEDVRKGMETIGYPAERIHYVKGRVEETTPALAPSRIAILRLDTDWYESTRHELEHLYPRLVSGGVLLIDDYGHWAGSRKAVDEWLEEHNERLLLSRVGKGRLAVKP